MVKLCGFSCLCPWTSGKSVREYSLVLSRSGAYTWWWRLFGWVVRAGRSATAFPALGPGPRRLRRRGPGPPASLGRPSGAAGPLCKREPSARRSAGCGHRLHGQGRRAGRLRARLRLRRGHRLHGGFGVGFSVHYTFALCFHLLRLRRARLLASALGSGRQKLSTFRGPPVGLHRLWSSSASW